MKLSLMKSALFKYCLMFFLCLPLLFINIKSSHDWGDDFAQYIHQAINIYNGTSQLQTGYIYNPQFMMGPPAYPSGFPLLLVPVYALFGNSIYHFDLYMSLFLFTTSLLMFYFFQKHFSALISGLIVLVFIYNPWTLNFKTEIMSEFPFTLLLLISVLLYQRVKPESYIQSFILALLSGLLISIRNIGLVFFVAILMDWVLRCIQNRSLKNNLRMLIPAAIIMGFGFITYLLICRWILPCTQHGIFSYGYSYNPGPSQHYILNNIYYNLAVLRSYFEPWNDQWSFISVLCGTMIFSFIVLGAIKKMSGRLDFIDILVIFYFIAIIAYPISNAGFRFLFPLAPFLFYYAIEGIQCINIKFRVGPPTVALIITFCIFFSYQKGWSDLFQSRNKQLGGPQDPNSSAAFDFIVHNTSESARFCFLKPRALSLYTGRSAMSNRPLQNLADIHQSFLDNIIQYVLIDSDISDDSLKTYVRKKGNELTKIWNNSNFQLYRRDFAFHPSANPRIRYYENEIVQTEDWREKIRQKAFIKKIPIDSMIYLDAKYMCDQEKK